LDVGFGRYKNKSDTNKRMVSHPQYARCGMHSNSLDGENMIRRKVLVRKRDGQIRVINTENTGIQKTTHKLPLPERKAESGEDQDREDRKSPGSEPLHY
jgi:hypothetical protein